MHDKICESKMNRQVRKRKYEYIYNNNINQLNQELCIIFIISCMISDSQYSSYIIYTKLNL